ncbi:hypothetical protein LguiB_013277 [Lonicera macranthoides]
MPGRGHRAINARPEVIWKEKKESETEPLIWFVQDGSDPSVVVVLSVENTTPLRSEDNTISQMGNITDDIIVPKAGRSNTLFPNKYQYVQLDISISMTCGT